MFLSNVFSIGSRRCPRACVTGFSLAGFLLFVLTFVSASAQEEPPPEKIPSDLPYANEWREARDRLGWKHNELRELANDFAHYKDFTRSDLIQATNAYAPIFAAWEKVIAAYRKGEVTEARALRKETELAKTAIDWKERLYRRKAQAEAWIEEEWAKQIETEGGRLARSFASNFVNAKRRASMSWGRVADAMVPGAERQKIIELNDQAHAAESEVRLMESLWHSKRNVDGMLWDAKLTSPEMISVLETITKLENEEIALNKDTVEMERRRRDIERRHKQAEKELAKAFGDAIKAREAAKKQPK